MNFKLLLPSIPKDAPQIISRAMKKQRITAPPLTRPHLKKLLTLSKTLPLPPYLIRRKLPGKLGHGIFLHPSSPPLLKGTLIAPYSGDLSIVPKHWLDDTDYAFEPICDLLLTKPEQAQFDPKKPYRPSRLYTLKLDALRRGNFTRFINHSHRPNISAELFSIPRNPAFRASPAEIVYFAKRTILPGEQLLVSYEDGEKTYWAALGIKPFPMTPRTFRLSPTLRLLGPK